MSENISFQATNKTLANIDPEFARPGCNASLKGLKVRIDGLLKALADI